MDKENERNKDMQANELFQASHLMILLSYTFFNIILMVETILMNWETWSLPLMSICILVLWYMHLTRLLSDKFRTWIYSIFMMVALFYYGIHFTSTYDITPVIIAIIMLYSITGYREFIILNLFTYYITIGYELIYMIRTGVSFDMLLITRTLLHLVLVFTAGWVADVIIKKLQQVLNHSSEEIILLTEATHRMDDFLANVSHEIRTPVNAVIGLTGVCMEMETNEEIKKNMQAISDAGKRVAEQISDILDYSEIDVGRLAVGEEDYMISSVMNDIVMDLKSLIPAELELVIDVDPATPAVMNTDVGKLKKILRHPIMNGLKYTREGGVYVRISAAPQSYGVNLLIEVTDTGIGMEQSEIDLINEGFYQANSGRTRSTSGLGLGMSVVYGFVRALGGFIFITSKVGEGTSVHISLPQKVVNSSECMSLKNGEQLCLGAWFRFEKYSNPNVREYYNAMVRNLVSGLKATMHRANNVEELKRLTSNIRLTHLFVGQDEYESDTKLMEKLAESMKVIVVARDDFMLPPDSLANIMTKPFYCFPVVGALNISDDHTREGRMFLRGVRALVVDDEPMNLIVAKGIFSRYGMVVSTVNSGKEAVRICLEQDFNIVFMDHMMPEMDGIETMKRIRRSADREHNLPIVALTANAVSSAKEMFLSEGFDGFISKPIELAELERVIRRVLPDSTITMEETPYYEKITPQKSVVYEESIPTDLDVMESLRKLGVDTAMGIHYCQEDKELYISLLSQFVMDAEKKKKDANHFFSENRQNDYAILVHSIKSTEKMIGAMDISEAARVLEHAAKTGDMETVKRNHEKTFDQYSQLTEGIRKVLDRSMEDPEVSQLVPEDDEEIFEFTPEGGDIF